MTRRASLAASLVAAIAVATASASASDPWAELHRPFHLPRLAQGSRCPVSQVDRRVDWPSTNIFGGSGIGPGPVYPGLGATARIDPTPDRQYGGSWRGAKVFWYVLPSYRGPVLIRGRRLGDARLRFDGGTVPGPELRILPQESVMWDRQPVGSRGRPSAVRVEATGCYGVQIDGTRFSRVVVVRVS